MRQRISHTLAGTVAAAALLVGLPVHATELVTNGGFETGDFTGWTTAGDQTLSGVDSQNPHSGASAAYFGTNNSIATMAQTLATTAGTNYAVSFWLGNEVDVLGVSAPNSFAFSWDGTTETTLTNAAAFGYTQYSFVLPATGSSTVLNFSFRQDPAFWDIDDISVTAITAVPEPGSMALLGTGLFFVAVRAQRARKSPN